ncbi:MAG: helix-turn-helix domain-containing protein, partial [Bacteroidales bacterium]|nr:helix-turn-helix domain-containing protein [Bacteroidales bacterium]
EFEEAQSQDWDIPGEETLRQYEEEFATGKYPSHRTVIREIKFLQEMVGVQKYYLQKGVEFLKGLLSDKSPKEPIEQIQEKPKEKEQPNEQEKTTDKDKKKNGTIGGIRGLMDYLGCCKSTAQAISNDGALKKAGIQYMAGNKWFWKKKELDAYLKANPEILRRVRNRRRS